MKNIEKWLKISGINYKFAKWGNPYYFMDNFFVTGLMVTFDFNIDPDARQKKAEFEHYMRRKRLYDCKCYRYGSGWWYKVLTVSDAEHLKKHEQRITNASEAFWQAEHEKRIKYSTAI